MMDEIDKIGADYRGDPSSALLEVLDPEQNNTFSDHYMNMPFDLSKVMFITTANMSDTIPGAAARPHGGDPALRLYPGREDGDRQKIPAAPADQGKWHQNQPDQAWTTATLEIIISQYTHEAGVRNLEREMGKVCRKMARKVAEGGKGPYVISDKTVDKYLGPPKFLPETEMDTSCPARPGGRAGLDRGRRRNAPHRNLGACRARAN